MITAVIYVFNLSQGQTCAFSDVAGNVFHSMYTNAFINVTFYVN